MSPPNNSRAVTGQTTITQRSNFVSASANRTGEMTEFLEIRTPAGYEFEYPADGRIEMFLYTHEQFTAAGGAPETLSLSHKLADSPALRGGADDGTDESPPGGGQSDVVVYVGGTRTTPAEVRYDHAGSNPNEVDVATSADDEVDVYYVWRDSSLVEGRWYQANEEEYEQVFGSTAGQLHTASSLNIEENETFSHTFTAGPKERVKFMVNTAVNLEHWNAFKGSGDGPNSTDSMASFRLPVRKHKTDQNDPRRGSDRGRRGGLGTQRGRRR